MLMLSVQSASARGIYEFDFATQDTGLENYTKHWSNAYPPDPEANIIIYSAAYDLDYKRMSAVSFTYIISDRNDNIVKVDQFNSFNRNYEPNIIYYTFHPQSDWIEGIYKVEISVRDRIDQDAYDDVIHNVNLSIDGMKQFYETGENAEDLNVLYEVGQLVENVELYFEINKDVTVYPPDRFILHDVKFIDDNIERILGEKLKIEVKVDNNYKDEGTMELFLLVNSSVVTSQEITVKGYETATVVFDAKAGKIGEFKIHFAADSPDVKFKNAELKFSIIEEKDAISLNAPKFEITGMNPEKEFVEKGESISVSITAINNGKTGNKTITVYSNEVPIGSTEIYLQYLEEKTFNVPVTLENVGVNKITVSDAPQLYRNVFVQKPETILQKNPIVKKITGNSLKVAMVFVFMIFSGILYYIRKKLK